MCKDPQFKEMKDMKGYKSIDELYDLIPKKKYTTKRKNSKGSNKNKEHEVKQYVKGELCPTCSNSYISIGSKPPS